MTEARAFRYMIEASDRHRRRGACMSLVPAYRENPQQLVRQLWLDAYRRGAQRPAGGSDLRRPRDSADWRFG